MFRYLRFDALFLAVFSVIKGRHAGESKRVIMPGSLNAIFIVIAVIIIITFYVCVFLFWFLFLLFKFHILTLLKILIISLRL